jgi:hypothetical protein
MMTVMAAVAVGGEDANRIPMMMDDGDDSDNAQNQSYSDDDSKQSRLDVTLTLRDYGHQATQSTHLAPWRPNLLGLVFRFKAESYRALRYRVTFPRAVPTRSANVIHARTTKDAGRENPRRCGRRGGARSSRGGALRRAGQRRSESFSADRNRDRRKHPHQQLPPGAHPRSRGLGNGFAGPRPRPGREPAPFRQVPIPPAGPGQSCPARGGDPAERVRRRSARPGGALPSSMSGGGGAPSSVAGGSMA